MKSNILKNTTCILFCLCIGFFDSSYGSLNEIPAILDEFQIHHPIIINTLIDAKNLMSIVKCMSFKGHRINFSQNRSYQPYQSYLIFTNLRNFKWNLPTYVPILVVSRIKNENDLKEVDVSIGSQVLFLDWFSLKVYESYTVNKIPVTRYLGQFQEKKKDKQDMIYVQSMDYKFSMEKRRENFYGLQIKVGTTKRALGISNPADFSNQVTFFSNNDTYDVTNLVNISEKIHGFFMVLKWMETKFNFTAKVFLRKDMKFGSPKVLSNGSIVLGEGAVRDLFEGSIDFLCTPAMMSPERTEFGTFLPPIFITNDAIVIPKVDSVEYLDWDVFLNPFSKKMWMALFLKCIVFSIFAFIIEWLHNYNMVRSCIMYVYIKNFNL